MAENYRAAINRSQKRLKTKGTRAEPRTTKPAAVDTSRSVEAGARTKFLRAGYREIENRAAKETNARRFQTRAELETKVRAESKAGKIARGQIQSTIDRRLKATQSRKNKFQRATRERVITEKNEVLLQTRMMTAQQLGVRTVQALVVFVMSKDVRQVVLTFTTAGDVNADAREALKRYMQAEKSPPIISVTVL